jgi:radical SAM superfamily enzyme YgiQ (UPF0313 family)
VEKHLKRALFVTPPPEAIVKTAMVSGRPVTLNTIEECYDAANNMEYQGGFILPNYALEFIKANVPSVDILSAPTWGEYEDAVRYGEYEIVGISFRTYLVNVAIKMAQIAREYDVKTIWAGNVGASTPGLDKYFDRTFVGFAEAEIKQHIEGRPLEKYAHPILISNISLLMNQRKVGYLFTMRGCTSNCKFCNLPKYRPRVIITPYDEIVRLLDIYKEMGVTYIMLGDESFFSNPGYADKIVKAMHQKGMTWYCTTRADNILGKVKYYKEHGMERAYVGIETVNNQNLKSANKGEGADVILKVLEEFHENNCNLAATYVLGFDHDTPESIIRDIDVIKCCEVFGVCFWVYTPFPNTELHFQLSHERKIIDDNWEHYDCSHLVWKHPHISPAEMEELRRYAIREACHPLNYRKRKVLRKLDQLMTSNGLRSTPDQDHKLDEVSDQ